MGRVTLGDDNKIDPMEAVVEYIDSNEKAHRVEVDFTNVGCSVFFTS